MSYWMDEIPDEVFYTIFSYLGLRSVCCVSRICRRWHRISQSTKFWENVDLSDDSLNLNKLWSLIRSPHMVNVKSLTLLGLLGKLRRRKRGASSRRNISDAVLREVCTRAPNLNKLILLQFDLSTVDVGCLPQNLTTLSLKQSVFGLTFLGTSTSTAKMARFGQLSSLDLSYCPSFSSQSHNVRAVISIAHQLKILRLRSCYKVSKNDFNALIQSLVVIQVLDISDNGTDLVNDTLCHILSYQTKPTFLRSLNLSFCSSISDFGINTLFSQHSIVRSLISLYISCTNVSKLLLNNLCLLSNLKLELLVVAKRAGDSNEIDSEIIDRFNIVHPDCRVVTKMQSTLISDNEKSSGFNFFIPIEGTSNADANT